MNTLDVSQIGSIIKKYYKEPIKEKYQLPTKTKIVTKTIEVEEPVDKERTITKKNPIPGIVIIIVGVILGISPIGSDSLSLISFVVGAIGGGIAIGTIKKKVIIKETITEKVTKTIEEEVELPPEFAYKDVPHKYSIESISSLDVDFNVVEIKDSRILIPETDMLSSNNFEFPTINKYKSFRKEDAIIEEQSESIPYVLDGDTEEQPLDIETTYGKKIYLRGFEKDLNSHFQDTEETFSKLKKIKIDFPIISDTDLCKYLEESKKSILYSRSDSLTNLIHSEQGIEFEEYMQDWITQWKSRMLLMNRIRINSLQNEISPEFMELGQTSQYTSFNFYCPDCNKEIQEDMLSRDYSVQEDSTPSEVYFSKNTRCKFNPVKNIWKCPVCENSYRQPIPVHKLMDELFLPVYDKLMEENKVEREKHHSEMRKKEIEMRYKMKEELEKIYFEHVSGIFELHSNMDKMQAEIEGESEAIYYMDKLAREQKNIHSNVISNIVADNIRMEKEILEQAERTVRQMEEFKNAELGQYDDKMNVLSKAKKIEDERKHQENIGMLEELNTSVQDVGNKVVENTEAVNENTDVSRQHMEVTKKGFTETHNLQKRANALTITWAKKQGHDLRDHSPWRVDKTITHSLSDAAGSISGRSTAETEFAKEN